MSGTISKSVFMFMSILQISKVNKKIIIIVRLTELSLVCFGFYFLKQYQDLKMLF